MPVRALTGEPSGRAGGLQARPASRARQQQQHRHHLQGRHRHYPNLGHSEAVAGAGAGAQGSRRVVRRCARAAGVPLACAAATWARSRAGRRQQWLRPRGLEDHIEEALTQQSFSELDEDPVDLDSGKKKSNGVGSSGAGAGEDGVAAAAAGGFCGSPGCGTSTSGQDLGPGATGLERQLSRLFGAAGLTRYATFVKDKVAFTYVSGALLVASAAISWTLRAAHLPAAFPVALMQRLAAACLCGVYAIMGVPAFLDVAYNLAALKVNIHVLTMLAVLGSVVIGSPLEGGLLLVLFESAHMIEGRLTKAAKGNLAALFEGAPKVATTVDVSPQDASPIYATERSVRVETVQVRLANATPPTPIPIHPCSFELVLGFRDQGFFRRSA